MTDDEDRIRRTLAEYSHRVDDGRFDQLEELFTEDARFLVLGSVHQGRAAIRSYLESVQGDGSRGKHVTTNSIVDVDGDTASVVTDYLLVRPTSSGVGIVAAGRYHDELARQPDRWRFTSRTISMLGDQGTGC
jgi:uncharacterized protein (TIGR02246 family)